ncbi:hypothetical protein LTR70_000056 [Exophiala xenobiotica]|uniref:Phosphoglycerate mutase n=1 Tax=Lithohypha guttulata TaxID=1690604 RepID=A0ABR0KQL7_9EURO|nr:hypothetical protein LTR24_000180 [Lithohypha guttulata]KAK5330734.1 hypothetical protein LTR70_000056 [Exophiala xenobiotica]
MRLLLIRHGETEHNVAGLLAGVTDSRLTNHGLIQAQRLASHLVRKRQLRFSQVFASDLQRALRTAQETCELQNAQDKDSQIRPFALTLLREQDFGSFELLPWNRSEDAHEKDPSPGDPGFRPKETAESLKARADTFLDDFLQPLFALDEESELTVAVVSHGLFLAALWKVLLLRFKPSTVSMGPEVLPPGARRPLEYLPAWSNTGFLELEIRQLPVVNPDQQLTSPEPNTVSTPAGKLSATMKICAVNSKEHLANLKRTRGGVGSSAADDKQKRLENFFKRPKMGT